MTAPAPEENLPPPPPYPGEDKGGAYPPQGGAYPPQGGAYPPQGGAYPPQGGAYPPQGGAYPPQGGAYPPQGGVAPPQQAQYPAQPAGYPVQPNAGQPQQAGYQQSAYPSPQQTVVVTQPATHTVTTTIQHFGDAPANTKCPNCQNQVVTVVSHEPGTMAWLICLLLFCFGFWLCCFIPFCVEGMQNANHTCPVCKYRIATYNR